MDIVFIMGMVLGFLLGIGFCLFFTHMLGHTLLKVLGGKPPKKKKRDDNEDDEPANYWKPEGWKPDRP